MTTVFLRVLEAEDKAVALLEAVRESEPAKDWRRFEVDPKGFVAVPRSPFAYWVSERLRGLFSNLPPFEAESRSVCSGPDTGQDFRCIRTWWEREDPQAGRWVIHAKGGVFSPYYSDSYLLLLWGADGRELLPIASANIRNSSEYFRPGLTWPLRTSSGLSMRAMPAGCVFGHKGPGVFVENDDSVELLALLASANSRAFRLLVSLQLAAADAAARSYEVGLIQTTPVPRLTDSDRKTLARLARRAWSLKRSLDTCSETSHAFTLPALLQVAGADLAAHAVTWSERVCTVEAELGAIQAEIDDCCFEFYGIEEADRRAIAEGFGTQGSDETSSDGVNDTEDDAGEDGEDDDSTADVGLAAELVSWAVGVAFGRFDVRLATGARPMPTEPEPFDPLPVCSPSMLTGGDGQPLARPPAGYPLAFPEAGVLVDDPGHVGDLTAAVRAAFDAVFGVAGDRWWQDVAALLDSKGHDLRVWLAGSFFEHHIKRHSKSRRKAPIFWQLGPPSGRYSVWLYAHRLTRDSFFQLQNEVVGPKITHEERQLTNVIQNAGSNPSARERKDIATQEALVDELRAMLDEVKKVAPLWNPDLDDGIVLTMAPLWRLVPQHKPWQKELKARWNELAAGKYDWAHLAIHLWPERVVPKCVTDRSVAIAHGLEHVFWVEDLNQRWRVIGSRTDERDYVKRYWAASALCKILQLARELWEQRYRDSGQRDDSWWQDVASGSYDDHPLALLVWPERVCRRAFDELQIAAAHGFTVPKQATGLDEEKERVRCEWVQKMLARYVAVPEHESFLGSAFSVLEDAETWQAWWEHFDRGELDHRPIAPYLRPAAVSEKCQNNLELAIVHGVERFFFVDRGTGLSARLEPAAELSREVNERSSPAVKAALSNLVHAPVAGTKSHDRNRRRARPAELGGSR